VCEKGGGKGGRFLGKSENTLDENGRVSSNGIQKEKIVSKSLIRRKRYTSWGIITENKLERQQ